MTSLFIRLALLCLLISHYVGARRVFIALFITALISGLAIMLTP